MAGEKQVYDVLKKEFGDPIEEAGKAFFNIFGKPGKKIDWLSVAGQYPPGTKLYAKSGVTGDWIIIGGRSDDPGIKLPESAIEFKFDGIQGSYAAVIPEGPPIMVGQETATKEPPGPKSDLDSWAWTQKYLQAQRQVAQAKAIKPPPGPVEQLTIEKVALPAAGIGLAWWLLKGF